MAPSAISPITSAQESRDQVSNRQLDVDAVQSPTSGHTSNTNGHLSQSEDETLDLLCIGFGPASLAIAIALQDAYTSSSPRTPSMHAGGIKIQTPKVLFMEKQSQFAWHAGMQLPGAKMQISFLKDLATPRDPRSRFTFLNYLFEKGRLNQFINLGTFLPTRVEYEDYLRWCAGHFEREGKVAYGMEVEGVRVDEKSKAGNVSSFLVSARDRHGNLVTRRARHVVIAVGGRPIIPQNLSGLKHVAHSSQYATAIGSIHQKDSSRDAIRISGASVENSIAQSQNVVSRRPLRFAVVGSGQSAAEIFNDLWERFPDSEVKLIIKGASLRPSDDSPFVNEIFDPDRVDGIYNQKSSERAAAIALDRGTNYGVVRLELLEHLYEKLYMQRLRNSDETQWRCRILPNRVVISAKQSADSGVMLKLGFPENKQVDEDQHKEENLEVDYVFAATGYRRNAHEDILSEIKGLLPDVIRKEVSFPVARNYRVQWDENKVDPREAGVWLQGCNEGTHGLSDTLLSILAVRGGELVNSIFGD